MDFIQLSHGSGGEETNKLIEELFFKYLAMNFFFKKMTLLLSVKYQEKLP